MKSLSLKCASQKYFFLKRDALFLCLLCFFSINTRAQYIGHVYDYRPAPGQLINSWPWGAPSNASSIVGGLNGRLCLGAFGGSVVFGFDAPVENHPDNPFGVDFTIFGNASDDWSEAAVVWVMKDDNANGMPDDTWYELAGSDYYFSSSGGDYQICYINPGGDEAADVPWFHADDSSGNILANSYHEQPYYPLADSFPMIKPDTACYSGSIIAPIIDTSDPVFIKSYERAFGYADNKMRGNAPYTIPDNPYTAERENAGGDAFDISWAVDASGNYVDLDMIDFVKVQTAVIGNAGWLGELSAEICGAIDVEADNSISGISKMILIKDLPAVIRSEPYQVEAIAFDKGRKMDEEPMEWTASLQGAFVDDELLLHLSESGTLLLTARLKNYPGIAASVSCEVDLSSGISDVWGKAIRIMPNPVRDKIRIEGVNDAEVMIFDMHSSLIYLNNNYSAGEAINCSLFTEGVYLLHIRIDKAVVSRKFIKQ